MTLVIEGILATIFLIPGFLCIFLPYWVIARTLRYSNLVLTLISLFLSIGIFGLTYWTYQGINLLSSSIESINISSVAVSDLVNNWIFLGLFLVYTAFFIGLGFYFIPQDRVAGLRAWIAGDKKTNKHFKIGDVVKVKNTNQFGEVVKVTKKSADIAIYKFEGKIRYPLNEIELDDNYERYAEWL